MLSCVQLFATLWTVAPRATWEASVMSSQALIMCDTISLPPDFPLLLPMLSPGFL